MYYLIRKDQIKLVLWFALILSENKQHCIANSPAIEVSTVKKATPSGQKARTEVLVFQPLYYVYSYNNVQINYCT